MMLNPLLPFASHTSTPLETPSLSRTYPFIDHTPSQTTRVLPLQITSQQPQKTTLMSSSSPLPPTKATLPKITDDPAILTIDEILAEERKELSREQEQLLKDNKKSFRTRENLVKERATLLKRRGDILKTTNERIDMMTDRIFDRWRFKESKDDEEFLCKLMIEQEDLLKERSENLQKRENLLKERERLKRERQEVVRIGSEIWGMYEWAVGDRGEV